ncbi:hypothetical protein [Kitasatospora sp. MBT66]|uniref:hypothetical protein n=1 Tax=Kitasatospora sp. MBT66 TaxID=1444769 RepID=UPI0005BBC8A9|nr:hypothetical protein [Kitasatospora sp. MBT66]
MALGAFFNTGETIVHADQRPREGCIKVQIAVAKRLIGTNKLDLSVPLPEGFTLCPRCESTLKPRIEELAAYVAEDNAEESEETESDETAEEKAAREKAEADAEKEAAARKRKRDQAEAKALKGLGVRSLTDAQANWLRILEQQVPGTPAFDFWNAKVDAVLIATIELDEIDAA